MHCRYHPDAEISDENIKVTSKEGYVVHKGNVCDKCGLILSVGGRVE